MLKKLSLQAQKRTMPLWYGFHTTPFGECLLGITDRGICHLSFNQDRTHALEDLAYDWPEAALQEDVTKTQIIVDHLFATKKPAQPFHANLHLKGTPFQLQVWDALLSIERGTTISYEGLAQSLGKPNSTRAVANAIAHNNIAVIIPCHRVIAKNGGVHKYRWGAEIKKALIAWEANNQKNT